jgi:photosystem II stability/assembly factor-like uncharacterized protein
MKRYIVFCVLLHFWVLVKSQDTVKYDTIYLRNNKSSDSAATGECSGFAICDNKLWVANDGEGVFYSTDSGSTFVNANDGLGELLVTAICSHNNKVYCATKFKGLYMYDNAKNRWYKLKKGLTDSTFWSLESNGVYIFASSEDNGIFRSKDGLAWEKLNIKLDNQIHLDSVIFTGKNILYSNETALYVATPHKVFFSMDNGSTWKKINIPTFPSLGNIQFISGEQNTLLLCFFPGGVYITKDNGRKWDPVIAESWLYPWSAEYLNNKIWICGIFRHNGGLYVIDKDYSYKKLAPFKWVNHITFYEGSYYIGGKYHYIYKFNYPDN